MKAKFQYATCGIELKSLDPKNGIVTGYASAFGNIDSDEDMITYGAYSKTISEWGPKGKNRIVHLRDHKTSLPLAKPTLLKEDSTGLYFESKISLTTYGMDTLKLYEDGVINEHSVGFIPIKSEFINDPVRPYNKITEVKLFEFSSVLWGANEDTPFTGFKSELEIENVFDRLMKLYKSFRGGNMTDETYELLEIEIHQLESKLKSQFCETQKPTNIVTPEAENPIIKDDSVFDENKFYNALKKSFA